MEITKKAVQERLAALKEQRDQKAADMNAYNGAIQDCEFWLAELEKQAPEKQGLRAVPAEPEEVEATHAT